MDSLSELGETAAGGVFVLREGMPQLIGKYEVTARLAVGGSTEIYAAKLKRDKVAVKQLLPHLARDKRQARSFIDAARVILRIVHPNIVHVREFDEADGAPFLVMELVDGISLDELCRRLAAKKLRLTPQQVAHLGAQLADALHYAHTLRDADGASLGVVHRDVNPHHVLIDNKGRVKLCDFGSVKAHSNIVRTTPGMLKGTVSYMPPEQRSGGTFDHRADIYALGVTLNELLVGSASAPGGPAELARLRPDAPPSLVRIIVRATDDDANLRYPTAAGMSRELQACTGDAQQATLERELAKLVNKVK